MNILVIAPHPDDEAIGCGGSIRLHADRGDRVAVVFLTSGELGLEHLAPEEAARIREREAAQASAILGVVRSEFLRLADWFLGDDQSLAVARLVPILREEHPARIYLPHPEDAHPDHRCTLPVVRAALREAALSAELWAYEIWSPLVRAEEIADITAAMPAKLRAVRCYGSQLASFRYDRAVRGLNQYRGALFAKCAYAEAFEALGFSGE